MNKKQTSKPELLAPAGSMESFNAAIEAGADAVYLGVGELNARLRARNFTLKSLSYLVNQARAGNVKIYVTLNTLVKQDELKSVLNILYQLKQLRVDAIIVQDLGLAHLAHKYFPELPLHASTQMVIHNSAGLEAAHQLGIKRVVLSRELTLVEIEQLARQSPVELEVFIHGALCYSISGLCLASSYIGGWSGNRGKCTQVCRRKFESGDQSGFYFSPKDLWAADYIKELSAIGIHSLKIEGRMKRAEYVYSVVSAYRKMLDNGSSLAETKTDLQLDLGREKTTFLLGSAEQPNIIVTNRPSGTGILLGKIKKILDAELLIETDLTLHHGDQLRLQNQEGDEGVSFVVTNVRRENADLKIMFQADIKAKPGDEIFLISRKQARNSSWNRTRTSGKATPFQQVFPGAQKVLNSLTNTAATEETADHQLYVKVDHFDWLNILKSFDFDFLIVSGSKELLWELLQDGKQISYWKQKLVIGLPPFIGEGDLNSYQELINDFHKKGITKWMCSHFSQKNLFPKDNDIWADSSIWTTNQATRFLLLNSGFNRFSYSPEDDLLNIKVLANGKGIMPIFAYIPVFISRIRPDSHDKQVTDSNGQSFKIKESSGLFYTYGNQPYCLFHRQEKLKGIGIKNFLIDFSLLTPSRKVFKSIIYDYQNEQKVQNSTQFNHKSGLK